MFVCGFDESGPTIRFSFRHLNSNNDYCHVSIFYAYREINIPRKSILIIYRCVRVRVSVCEYVCVC